MECFHWSINGFIFWLVFSIFFCISDWSIRGDGRFSLVKKNDFASGFCLMAICILIHLQVASLLPTLFDRSNFHLTKVISISSVACLQIVNNKSWFIIVSFHQALIWKPWWCHLLSILNPFTATCCHRWPSPAISTFRFNHSEPSATCHLVQSAIEDVFFSCFRVSISCAWNNMVEQGLQ